MKLAAKLALWSSLLIASPALAATAPSGDTPGAIAPDGDGLVRLAQVRDAEVYYDDNGNQVIVDIETGEIISVRPPDRATRRELRRETRRERQREIRRRQLEDDLYAAPDRYERPQRYERPRRYEPEYSERAPAEEYYPYEDFPEQAAPPPRRQAPEAIPVEPRRQPAVPPQPEVVERQPLPASPSTGEPAVREEDRGPQTGSVVAPSGEPPTISPPAQSSVREDVAALQILLDRAGASPGVIDGRFGSNVDKAIVNYRAITGQNLKSTDTARIKEALAATGGDPFTSYTITAQDAAGPYIASVPEDYGQKARLERLSYTSVTEMLAERFHMDEDYLKALNRDANFNRPGTIIRVANVGAPVAKPVARIIADKTNKQVRAYGTDGKLVAAYPATIGSAETPSPTGTHAVSRIAFDPGYTYNPKVNFKQGDNDKILTLPPGPNGPVGSIWIALDKPTYGVHGTPEPSKIGKTESYGCVRLTNWDATELAKLVKPGVTVEFVE